MKTIIYGCVLTVLLTNCANRYDARDDYSNYDYYSESNNELEAAYYSADINDLSGADDGRSRYKIRPTKPIDKKIIKTASLTLITRTPDSTTAQLTTLVEKYNGYIKENSTYYSSIRVEAKFLDSALLDLESFGRIENKRTSGSDVSANYYDTKIRLENAERARERYLQLLDKAENVEAALLVEKELERLNETIDRLKGQLNSTDHLVAYSTINISIRERKKPGLIGYVGIGLYKSVKWLFVRN